MADEAAGAVGVKGEFALGGEIEFEGEIEFGGEFDFEPAAELDFEPGAELDLEGEVEVACEVEGTVESDGVSADSPRILAAVRSRSSMLTGLKGAVLEGGTAASGESSWAVELFCGGCARAGCQYKPLYSITKQATTGDTIRRLQVFWLTCTVNQLFL